MKKMLMLVTLFTGLSSFAADVYTCKSTDFDPSTHTGQSLNITLQNGTVSEIKKNAGSWYSDTGIVVNPRLISKNSTATVYSCDFHDDSSSGRFALVNSLKTAEFDFSDMDAGSMRVKLSCVKK
jgi:hypothetical protein